MARSSIVSLLSVCEVCFEICQKQNSRVIPRGVGRRLAFGMLLKQIAVGPVRFETSTLPQHTQNALHPCPVEFEDYIISIPSTAVTASESNVLV